MGGLKHLSATVLGFGSRIEMLPPEIASLGEVRELNLSGNKLTTVCLVCFGLPFTVILAAPGI